MSKHNKKIKDVEDFEDFEDLFNLSPKSTKTDKNPSGQNLKKGSPLRKYGVPENFSENQFNISDLEGIYDILDMPNVPKHEIQILPDTPNHPIYILQPVPSGFTNKTIKNLMDKKNDLIPEIINKQNQDINRLLVLLRECNSTVRNKGTSINKSIKETNKKINEYVNIINVLSRNNTRGGRKTLRKKRQ